MCVYIGKKIEDAVQNDGELLRRAVRPVSITVSCSMPAPNAGPT
jgi:hypothetical protein